MYNINKFGLNYKLDFIQLKLFDFSDEKIDYEKIISERLNKNLKILFNIAGISKISVTIIINDINPIINGNFDAIFFFYYLHIIF